MTKVLKFYTKTCSHCKMIAPMVEGKAVDGEFELQNIDAEEEREHAKQYDVMSVPTVVVLNEGDEPKVATGVMEIQKLINQ